MRLVRRCLNEVWSLFVDELWATLVMMAWVAVFCLLMAWRGVGAWSGPLLFAGIASILAGSLLARR